MAGGDFFGVELPGSKAEPGSLEEIQLAMAGAPEGSTLRKSLEAMIARDAQVRAAATGDDKWPVRYGRAPQPRDTPPYTEVPVSTAPPSTSSSSAKAGPQLPATPAPPVETGGYRPVLGSASTRTTVKESLIDPATIMEQLYTTMDQMKQTQSDFNAAVDTQTQRGQEYVGAVTAEGAAAAAAATAKGAIEIAKSANVAAVIDTLDLNPMKQDNLNAQAEKRRVAAQNAARDIKAKIDVEEQVAPWDDPLRWIVNQFTLPYLQKSYVSSVQAADMATKEITERNAGATGWIGVTTAAGPVTAVREASAAEAASLVAKSAATAAQVNFQVAGVQAQKLLAQLQMLDKPLEMFSKVATLFMTQHSVTQAERDAAKEDPTLARLNTKIIAAGGIAIPTQDWKQKSQATRDALINWSQYTQYGKTPGEAFLFLDNLGLLFTIGKQDPIAAAALRQLSGSDEVNAKLTELQGPGNPDVGSFRKLSITEQRAKAMDLVYDEQWHDLMSGKKDHATLPTSSPMYYGMLGAATTVPSLKDNWVAKDILDKRRVNPNYEPTAKDVAETLYAKSVAEPDKARYYAAEFSRFFREGQLYQHATNGTMKMGIPTPSGYTLKGYFTSGTTNQALQFWSPTQMHHWTILRQRQEAKYSHLMDPRTTPFAGDFGVMTGPLEFQVPKTDLPPPIE